MVIRRYFGSEMAEGARGNSANTANINKLNLTPDFSEYNLKVEACRCRIKFVPVQSKWKNLRHNSGFYLIATSPTDPCKPHETFSLPFFFLFHNLSSWAHAKSVYFFLEFLWLTKNRCIYFSIHARIVLGFLYPCRFVECLNFQFLYFSFV